MIRGQFLIKREGEPEVWIPNQFTHVGVTGVLQSAFRNNTMGTLYVGLCTLNPADSIQIGADMGEPANENGYARQPLLRNNVDWLAPVTIGGEVYIQSKPVTFTVTAPYLRAVNRLFLTNGTDVYAISSPLVGGMQFLAANLTTQYRLYLR